MQPAFSGNLKGCRLFFWGPSVPSPCGRGLGGGLFRLPENEVSAKLKQFSNRGALSDGRGGRLWSELRVAAGSDGSAGCFCISVAACVFRWPECSFLCGCRLLSGWWSSVHYSDGRKLVGLPEKQPAPTPSVQAAASTALKTAPSPARRIRWIRGFRTGTQSRGRRCRTAAPAPRPAAPRRAGRRGVCRPEAG